MSLGKTDDRACWYAVRTKSQEEDRADSNLRSWEIPTFAPKLKVRSTSSYDRRYVTKPLFSRYIFARFDVTRQLHDINYTRGVQNVVSFGGYAVAIDDRVIELIRGQVGDDGFIRMDDEFKHGDRITITSGPFVSLGGIFMRKLNGKDRVEILLNGLQMALKLQIEKQLVQKADLGGNFLRSN